MEIKQAFFNSSENKVTKVILTDGTELSAGNTSFATQNKVVIPALKKQVVTPDTNYDGLARVTVAATPLEEKTVSLADLKAGDVLTCGEDFIGFKSITITE